MYLRSPIHSRSNNSSFSPPSFQIIQSGTWYTYVKLTIAVLSFIICVLVICIIYRHKRLLLEHKNNIFLMAVLTTDACIGIVGTIIYAFEFVDNSSVYNRTSDLQKGLMLTLHFFYVVAFMMVILVTLDRFLAVKYPYLYDRFTPRICVGIITIFLIPPCIFVSLNLTMGRDAYHIYVLIAIVLSVLIAITNTFVYAIVKEKLLQTSKLTVTDDEDEKERQIRLSEIRKRKSAIISMSISLSTILFLLPSEICVACIMIMGPGFFNETTIFLTNLADVFVLANSLKDPVVYICMNRSVKKEMNLEMKRFVQRLPFSITNRI